jgi:hypothetical protein
VFPTPGPLKLVFSEGSNGLCVGLYEGCDAAGRRPNRPVPRQLPRPQSKDRPTARKPRNCSLSLLTVDVTAKDAIAVVISGSDGPAPGLVVAMMVILSSQRLPERGSGLDFGRTPVNLGQVPASPSRLRISWRKSAFRGSVRSTCSRRRVAGTVSRVIGLKPSLV